MSERVHKSALLAFAGDTASAESKTTHRLFYRTLITKVFRGMSRFQTSACPGARECQYISDSDSLFAERISADSCVRSRRVSGLRIDDAAPLCGVSVDLLSRLENGQSGVRRYSL